MEFENAVFVTVCIDFKTFCYWCKKNYINILIRFVHTYSVLWLKIVI